MILLCGISCNEDNSKGTGMGSSGENKCLLPHLPLLLDRVKTSQMSSFLFFRSLMRETHRYIKSGRAFLTSELAFPRLTTLNVTG